MPGFRKSAAYYVGLMSGTSMDGIDAALVEFGDHTCTVIATLASPYPDSLRKALLNASRTPAECTVDKIGQMDHWIGECFRDAANSLLAENEVDRDLVTAIGSHGQTTRQTRPVHGPRWNPRGQPAASPTSD